MADNLYVRTPLNEILDQDRLTGKENSRKGFMNASIGVTTKEFVRLEKELEQNEVEVTSTSLWQILNRLKQHSSWKNCARDYRVKRTIDGKEHLVFANPETLSKTYHRDRKSVSKYVEEIYNLENVTLDDFAQHTPKKFRDQYPQYRFPLTVDLTEVKSALTVDQEHAQSLYSHAKKQHAGCVIVLRFLDGTPAFVGDFILAAPAQFWTDTDEVAWHANLLTERLSILAEKLGISEIHVLGDKGYRFEPLYFEEKKKKLEEEIEKQEKAVETARLKAYNSSTSQQAKRARIGLPHELLDAAAPEFPPCNPLNINWRLSQFNETFFSEKVKGRTLPKKPKVVLVQTGAPKSAHQPEWKHYNVEHDFSSWRSTIERGFGRLKMVNKILTDRTTFAAMEEELGEAFRIAVWVDHRARKPLAASVNQKK